MPSGGSTVALCFSWSGLYLSCKSAGKKLAMWRIQKYKRKKKNNLVTEVIPATAKMNNCFLPLARLGKRDPSSVFSAIKWISSKFTNVSVFISEEFAHEA